MVIIAQEDVTYTLYDTEQGTTTTAVLLEGESDAYLYPFKAYAHNIARDGNSVVITATGHVQIHVDDDCRLWTSDFQAHLVTDEHREFYFVDTLNNIIRMIAMARDKNTLVKYESSGMATVSVILDQFQFVDLVRGLGGSSVVVKVTSTKPISLIAAYDCSVLTQTTCDAATSQILPVSMWSNIYMAPKYGFGHVEAEYTVISASAANVIDVIDAAGTGTTSVVLDGFEAHKLPITTDALDIRCSKPCYVQAVINRHRTFGLLETSMVYLPPQPLESASANMLYFSTEFPKTSVSGGTVFNESSLTLVAETEYISDLELNGNPLPGSLIWTDMPDTTFQYATLAIGKQVHSLRYRGKIYGYVYGPGQGDLEGKFRIIS